MLTAVKAILNVRFIFKHSLNIFTISKNVLNFRFLCNVQAGNASPKSMGFDSLQLSRNKKSGERLYFRNVMENNPKYPDLTFSTDLLKANENSANKLVIFLRNAVNAQISQSKESERFELTDFEDDIYTLHDIIEVFYLLPKYCELFSKPIESEVDSLSNLMERKIKKLKKTVEDIGPMLTLMNLMKDMEVSQDVPFPMLKFIYRRHKSLTVIQLLEYFYILHYYKLLHEKESKFMFEMKMANALPELNVDEVAVLGYAFFRAEFLPGSLLSEAVSHKILEEVENLNDIQACSLFKFLQFSGRRRISNNLIKIYEKCIPIIDKFTIMTAIHIVGAGVSVNTECKELFQLVWDRANKEYDNLRLKDIERLLLASLFTNFHITEDSRFVQLTLEKFGKGNYEIEKHPRSFFSLLKFLIMHDIYPRDLITYAMSKEYHKIVKEKYSKYLFEELVFIEGSVQVERPGYNLNPLPNKLRKTIVSKSMAYTKSTSSSFVCNMKIVNALKEMYHDESVVLIKPLIQYVTLHPILCINKKNEPQKIDDRLTLPSFSTIKAPEDGNLWIAFVLMRWQACLYDRVTPNLVSEAKLRQFRKAGYIPIMAYNFLLRDKSTEEVKEILKQAIKDNIPSLDD